ncbi:hypothetical protein NM688_g9188 [Phlebia brevispora]|uniref:Uncharacterized protein n=1 Tax=Phlebia brevispora TaxID=194682 RepID=A0ACC1RMQ5_9APHY|nr:hypothetical protein NM688_g9188 [Phlebia brevispora]
MSAKHLSSQRRTTTTSNRKASRVSTLRLDSPPPAKKQKLRPLSLVSANALFAVIVMTDSLRGQLSQPPIFDIGTSQPELSRPLSQKSSDQQKPRPSSQPVSSLESEPADDNDADDQLWVDRYAPQNEGELAVHTRKVRDVRQWFLEAFDGGSSGKLRKYRRILVLTGPAGTGKTATVRVLAKELGFDIVEWKNSIDERFDGESYDDDGRVEYEGLSEKFRKFFTRATSCNSIFGPSSQAALSSQGSQKPMASSSQPIPTNRQIILLEDLPNILHSGTQEAFHSVLKGLVKDGEVIPASPVVIILSDAGLRGEDTEDPFSVSTWKGKGREAVDVRTVLPSSVLASSYVTQISFNPIAPTLLTSALQHLLTTHFSSHHGVQPSKDLLDLIVESSNGDIRSAVMALQFACVHPDANASDSSRKKNGRKGKRMLNSRAVLEAVTRREQTLALFHLIGKILYNKRKGDAPAPSTSAKDARRDRDNDAKLVDPPKLPPHLKQHERKASRVDVEALYADSPIDASLLSLYIHQNYTQYCERLEECHGIMDWLSWVDSSGGESWLQANPHRFHLVTLGTMHSLPTPVPRRSQKPYKPEFFEALSKEREADDALRDVHHWLRHHEGLGFGWTRQDIATDIGAVLRARDSADTLRMRPPSSHRLFSRLQFTRDASSSAEIADDQNIVQEDKMLFEENMPTAGAEAAQSDADRGGWLDSDDIEDF